MSDILLFEQEGGIATLTFNTPDRGNSIDLDMAKALAAAAIRCDQDATIRCVVLTGAGRMFCVGGDIGLMQRAADAAGTALSELAGTLHMAVSYFARMAKPLLVLVNGPAAGAGMSLAILGDIVLAKKSAHFTTAYGAIGLTPDGGGSWLLPRLVGLRRAQELIFTNRRVAAPEAESIGLITRAIDDDMFAQEGAKMAAQLSAAATGAIGAARVQLLEAYGAGLEVQLEREMRSIARAAGGAEGREGLAAFLAKRKPDFAG